MKSPKPSRAKAYGPPTFGISEPSRAMTSARHMAPPALTSQPRMLIPPYGESDAGSRKTPEPTMLPTTRAVHIHSPRAGLGVIRRSGRALPPCRPR